MDGRYIWVAIPVVAAGFASVLIHAAVGFILIAIAFGAFKFIRAEILEEKLRATPTHRVTLLRFIRDHDG